MYSDRIKELLSKMTLEDKLGQMTLLVPDFFDKENNVDLTGPFANLEFSEEEINSVGSILNSFSAEKNINIQKNYLEKSKHKIPLLIMADIIHGKSTIFPINLALGCSFNTEAMKTMAKTAALESSVSGIHLTYAPMVDLVRDPRWGRVAESTGEDPYLNSIMAVAAVEGYQGKDIKEYGNIASCCKHFASYGAPEGGRDYNTVDMSEGVLRDFYLPAYKACVDADVKMMMTAFNIFDRIPSGANTFLYNDILRKEWGFKGSVISDYAALDETMVHGFAKDAKEAAKAYLEAGCDIEMMSPHYLKSMKDIAANDEKYLKLIDESVLKVLHLKEELGLFDNPYKDANIEIEKNTLKSKENLQKALEVARQCIVLLQNNNNVLPLNPNMKVGLCGPFATSEDVIGTWAFEKGAISLSDSLKNSNIDITVAMNNELGSMQEKIFDVDIDYSEVSKLKDCDVILACVGENQEDTGEGASRANIRLSANQEAMIKNLKQLNKPVIVLLFSARPLELNPIINDVDAILQVWHLGTESGNAIKQVLFNEYNPSGRLSMSFPQTVGQIPVYYNHYNTGRPRTIEMRYVSRYLDCPNEPLYPFGYGLSYSNFEYSNLNVAVVGETIKASVKVKNTSEHKGIETVQCYIRDIKASVVRPVLELKAIEQVSIEANSEITVEFEITKEMLKFHNAKMEYVFESGEFDICVGKNSSEYLKETVSL